MDFTSHTLLRNIIINSLHPFDHQWNWWQGGDQLHWSRSDENIDVTPKKVIKELAATKRFDKKLLCNVILLGQCVSYYLLTRTILNRVRNCFPYAFWFVKESSLYINRVSPSGKAVSFGLAIRRFESFHPSCAVGRVSLQWYCKMMTILVLLYNNNLIGDFVSANLWSVLGTVL